MSKLVSYSLWRSCKVISSSRKYSSGNPKNRLWDMISLNGVKATFTSVEIQFRRTIDPNLHNSTAEPFKIISENQIALKAKRIYVTPITKKQIQSLKRNPVLLCRTITHSNIYQSIPMRIMAIKSINLVKAWILKWRLIISIAEALRVLTISWKNRKDIRHRFRENLESEVPSQAIIRFSRKNLQLSFRIPIELDREF